MEITIKINGRMVSVEVNDEVAECYDQGRRKVENLYHEKRRHWDDREFDEYIAATEGLLPYQPTPEDIVPEGNPGSVAVHSGHLHGNSAGAVSTLCAIRLYL